MQKILAPFIAGLGILITALSPLFAAPASAAPTAVPSSPVAIKAYASVLRTINPHLPDWESRDLARHVLANAHRWKVDANLLVALVSVESAWRTHARSSVGAIGLGQLMPGTAWDLGIDPRNPSDNLYGAARYLSGLLARYQARHNQYQLAFAAYNAGPKAVARFGGIPPYYETQHYVVKVMNAWTRIEHTVHLPHEVLAQATLKYPHPDGNVPADLQYWSSATR
ncbi:MAG: lytic transglycosylase domain-containing protein [Vulcanimicrobiaceae bacterium]